MTGGNTFNGIIDEIPGIGIDKFNSDASVFLLTHFHADHLAGLDSQSFGSRVYCSRTTKRLVALSQKYTHVLPYLKELDPGKHRISVGSQLIDLIMIDSYHCPGSVMFLVEGHGKSVLVTGDIRAETWWLDTLAKNPYLFPYTTGLKTLSNMYVDTTFSYRGEPYIEMLTNNDCTNAVVQLLRSYPMENDDVQFFFTDSTSGFDEPWSQILQTFNGSLNLGKTVQQRVDALSSIESVSCVLKESCRRYNNPRFHVIEPGSSAKVPEFAVVIRQCLNFNLVDYLATSFPIPLDSITDQDSLKLLYCTSKGNKVYEFRQRKYLLSLGGTELLPKEIKLVFSRHSSYTETCNLVSMFRPEQVYPICESRTTWMNGFSMARAFSRYCKSSSFTYDKRMKLKYGDPLKSDEPVATVHRWTFEGCREEAKFVSRVLCENIVPTGFLDKEVENPFNFKGIHYFGSKKKPGFDTQGHIGRAKDFSLQKLFAGRNEETYRRKIDECQSLYSGDVYREVRQLFDNYDQQKRSEDSYSESQNSDYLLNSSPLCSLRNINQEDQHGTKLAKEAEPKHNLTALSSPTKKELPGLLPKKESQDGIKLSGPEVNEDMPNSLIKEESQGCIEMPNLVKKETPSTRTKQEIKSQFLKEESHECISIKDSATDVLVKEESQECISIQTSAIGVSKLEPESIFMKQNSHKSIDREFKYEGTTGLKSSFGVQQGRPRLKRRNSAGAKYDALRHLSMWEKRATSQIGTISTEKIDSISQTLSKDPNSWFSFTLNSVRPSRKEPSR